jgi:hypothetical protein
MMRGYRCKNKTAKEILTTLGFDGVSANRGWIMERTGRKDANSPVRMHAIIHYENGIEYIDLHADHPGPNDTHVTVRGRRVERWNELFRQVDHDEPCDAGQKLLAHYGGLNKALELYEKGKV